MTIKSSKQEVDFRFDRNFAQSVGGLTNTTCDLILQSEVQKQHISNNTLQAFDRAEK